MRRWLPGKASHTRHLTFTSFITNRRESSVQLTGQSKITSSTPSVPQRPCLHARAHPNPSLAGHPRRIFPVGRLDKDTTGAILLTTDGALPNACLRAEQGLPKVRLDVRTTPPPASHFVRVRSPQSYEVTTEAPLSAEDCRRLAEGVVITTTAQSSARPLTARTLPCKVYPIEGRRTRVTLKEGRNRQVSTSKNFTVPLPV